ncbi:MAG TPA: hypothetical protein PKB10_02545 [Tepidisphaeraceae bacterium]|nr:hypothetical protein [Tepidisphaeraceae bacterium]
MRLGGPRESRLPVFIPHVSEDDKLANQIYRQLRIDHEIPCYPENVDYVANPAGVSKTIIDSLGFCTGMIAVAALKNSRNWQTAYALGVAGCTQRLLAVFIAMPEDEVPDFLRQFPLLSTPGDVQQFAHFFKTHSPSIGKTLRSEEQCADETNARRACEEFTRRLKVALGQ